MKSKTSKILKALQDGKELSASKIRATYKVNNPSSIIANLRTRGYSIESTGRQGVRGKYYMAAD